MNSFNVGMWMSDKVKIQHELAKRLSKLMHELPNETAIVSFNTSFFRTMQREWHGIDSLR